MPELGLKRGRGRPKGSGKANSAYKVVKNHTPVRRSTRGSTAPRSQEDVDDRPSEEPDNYAAHASYASSDGDGSWEVDRQILLDENKELSEKCSQLEHTLRQTQNASASQAQDPRDAINASQRQIEELQESIIASQRTIEKLQGTINARQDRIDELRVEKSVLLQRAIDAEHKGAELEEQIRNSQHRQPGSSAGPSSSRVNRSLSLGNVRSPDEADAATPRPSHRAFGATRAPRERTEPRTRTRWPVEDEEDLIRMIAIYGIQWSKMAPIWDETHPDRPRGEVQLKDKAYFLKAHALKNDLPLPPKFDLIPIRAKDKRDIMALGRNPDREEIDVDRDGRPTNIWLVL